MKRSHITREIIELIVLALVVFLITRFVIHGYQVQGSNMSPSIESNSFVMVNRLSYLLNQPKRGDAIVVYNPNNPNRSTIVRIIGLPGDKIKTDNQHIWINGTQLNEPYVRTKFNPEGKEWTVAANSYFVLNDNRQAPDDSRTWGPITRDYFVGKAVLIFWPITTIRPINDYPETFKNVP